MSLPVYLAIGFLFGIGFGFFAQRAGFCVAQGLVEFFTGAGTRFLRLLLVVFAITGAGFLVSSWINPDLGLKVVGQIRGGGFYNILSGVLFGVGIVMTGGCTLGILRRLGEGNLNYLVVLLSFIPGMALVTFVLNPLLDGGYNTQKILLPDLFGVPDALVTGVLFAASLVWYSRVRPKKYLSAETAAVEDIDEPVEEVVADETAEAAVEAVVANDSGESVKKPAVSSESAIAPVDQIMKATEPDRAEIVDKATITEKKSEPVAADAKVEPVVTKVADKTAEATEEQAADEDNAIENAFSAFAVKAAEQPTAAEETVDTATTGPTDVTEEAGPTDKPTKTDSSTP